MRATWMLLSWLACPAVAAANTEPTLAIALTRQGGEHPWGVEVGGAWLVALGDACGYNESGCRGDGWWAIAGPRAAVTWRGGSRLGGWVEAAVGPAWVEIYHVGFFPIVAAYGAAGCAAEFGSPAALTLGGVVTKSLSYTERQAIPGGTMSRTYGADPLSLSVGGRARYAGEWLPSRWSFGLEMATVAAQLD